MRAMSLRRTKEPFSPARTMTLPNSSGVVRRPDTLPVYCFSCVAGAGSWPMVPAGACTFCSRMAVVTSVTVRPSSAKRSGFIQTRME